ncbi:MAG: hypothetical protein WKG00_35120 [Polyangiaceae bacterium]
MAASAPTQAIAAPIHDGARRRFHHAFRRLARGVRTRLALRKVLGGAALGLILGAAASGAAWRWHHGALRPWAATAGLVGAAAGLAAAQRRRWDDTTVALYLDGKLGSDETIVTALELSARSAKPLGPLESSPASSPGGADLGQAGAVVIAQASERLDQARGKAVRAPLWRVWHLALPLAAATIAFVTWLPMPPQPVAPTPPGVEKVTVADLVGLEKVIKLAELDARDDAQKKRLAALADEARKLREKLKTGVEKREAQADIAKLRDGITAEKLSLGDGEQRQGLESAIGKLGEKPQFKDAAKALGDRDLTGFDDEMEKLANKLEASDREQAKKTLEEAAEAARKNGAKDVAKMLQEQKRLMDQRGKQADALRELAEGLGKDLPPEAREALKDFQGSGSPADRQKLAESLGDALNGLSPEQRKQLAENLKKQLADNPPGEAGEGGGGELDPEQLKDLAERLGTPEGQKELAEQLKRMAEAPGPESEESERQRGLEQGEQGLGETEGQMGAPVPMPIAGGPGQSGQGQNKGPGQNGQGQSGDGQGNGQGNGQGQNQGDGTGGPGPGGGKGNHDGQTSPVDGNGVRARADARVNKARPMPGVVMGRAAGRAGETANVQGEGALGQVAPQEVNGVERSDVPEEYREQVGRYFNPR